MDYIQFILLLGLFFPRLAFIIGYFSSGILPNPFPFWLDFVLAFLVPRILFIVYIALNWSVLANPVLWMSLHVIGLLASAYIRRTTKKEEA